MQRGARSGRMAGQRETSVATLVFGLAMLRALQAPTAERAVSTLCVYGRIASGMMLFLYSGAYAAVYVGVCVGTARRTSRAAPLIVCRRRD